MVANKQLILSRSTYFNTVDTFFSPEVNINLFEAELAQHRMGLIKLSRALQEMKDELVKAKAKKLPTLIKFYETEIIKFESFIVSKKNKIKTMCSIK